MTCEYQEQCRIGKCKFQDASNCNIRNYLFNEEIEKMRREATEMYPILMNDCGLAHVPDRFRVVQPGREI
jgi:hypothetical protein